MSILELNNINKTYGEGEATVHALRNVNLSVKPGEFLAIMGPSGSGKSTLMHLLGCLDSPTSGVYLLDSEDVSTLSRDQLAWVRNSFIGFVFQGFNLLPRLTALQNVELPLAYRGMPKLARQAAALSALKRVGLADRVSHIPTKLSGGQQQRVAIARALVTEPALILADEPTGNLDSASTHDVMSLLTTLNQEGRTIVLITHEPEVAAFATRTIHVTDGKLA